MPYNQRFAAELKLLQNTRRPDKTDESNPRNHHAFFPNITDLFFVVNRQVSQNPIKNKQLLKRASQKLQNKEGYVNLAVQNATCIVFRVRS